MIAVFQLPDFPFFESKGSRLGQTAGKCPVEGIYHLISGVGYGGVLGLDKEFAEPETHRQIPPHIHFKFPGETAQQQGRLTVTADLQRDPVLLHCGGKRYCSATS